MTIPAVSDCIFFMHEWHKIAYKAVYLGGIRKDIEIQPKDALSRVHLVTNRLDR